MHHIEVSDLLAWADVYGCVIHIYVDRRQDDWFRKMTKGQSESPGFLRHVQGRERSSRQAWRQAFGDSMPTHGARSQMLLGLLQGRSFGVCSLDCFEMRQCDMEKNWPGCQPIPPLS